jgi:hypothetical protein
VLTTAGANVSHRDEDGMTVLEHAEQNGRKQVVTLIKRAQLANQMRQRRKQKTQQKDTGMTSDEYDRRAQEAQARADALLAVRAPMNFMQLFMKPLISCKVVLPFPCKPSVLQPLALAALLSCNLQPSALSAAAPPSPIP